MIQDQIADIQSKLESSAHIPLETKTSLLALLAELRSEVQLLAQTHEADAAKIAHFTQASTDGLAQNAEEPELFAEALEDLRTSVAGFETSHPKLAEVVSQLASTLSNMGI